ncbi:hypothetical protein LguiA_020033 [Lonicera macranthoides]
MEEPSSIDVPLPESVEKILQRICLQQSQQPANATARRLLLSQGEQAALALLRTISNSKIKKTLTAYIIHLAKKTINHNAASVSVADRLPHTRTSPPSNVSQDGASSSSLISNHLSFSSPSSSERANTRTISQQQLILSELEFRKTFLILSYIGRNKLEDVMSVSHADNILSLKHLPMVEFESKIWSSYGRLYCDGADRSKYLDWDSQKTHLYYCYVYPDGSYSFKGPYLNATKTHLQRALGDENVLIVKFAEEATDSTISTSNYVKISKEGILVGLRRYRFFVFKDGGKEEKKKSPTSSPVKCYFVRMESLAPCNETEPYILSTKTVHEARSLFMHLHMVDSMAKYAARFSLILSKTIKLPVNLDSVDIKIIDEIDCHDENGCAVCNEDGEPFIHTDGTGYISEDLAMKCPKDFSDAKYMKDESIEPLLIQCRLFYKGLAVKGTLLVNKKLEGGKIEIRPSMVKVNIDSRLLNPESLNSLEVVKISLKPKKNYLSKYLIALLSFGGVPQEYFLGLLTNALEDARSVFSNKRAALRVALNHGEIDDDFTTTRMILSGVPLNEPSLQHRLSRLANEERKGLKGGKLPITESFYLMGTADPTGVLNQDQVCVILDNGQISGEVLVYRNPGLHFGDIHVLNAVYVKELEDVIGNAKYGIFFSTKGPRSVASEIANGDFDGDMYWVSRNPQLLKSFKASEPWTRIYSTPNAVKRKPSEFSSEELEHEYFQLFLNSRKQRSCMGVAADSWLAFMDRLLILGDGSAEEKDCMKETMLKLVDIYYDALDAPKSGKKVKVPNELTAELYPHYMERENKYHSTSVLGQIYDTIQSSQTENLSTDEIWKLPCFDVEIPEALKRLWEKRYSEYRWDMTEALRCGEESKNYSANEVTKKYKQMVYGAEEFEASPRKTEDIYNDALALYHATYDYARTEGNVVKCSFVWKVAGSALCKFYAMKQNEKSMVCVPSVLKDVLN